MEQSEKNLLQKEKEGGGMERLTEMGEYFDKWAAEYDDLLKYESVTGEEIWRAPKAIAKKLLPLVPKHSRIVDAGAGTGLSSVPFLRAGHEVIGIDISAKMLQEAKEKGEIKKLVQGSIEELPFKDNIADASISVGAMTCVKDLSKTIKEMLRVTKRNGFIAFTIDEWRATEVQKEKKYTTEDKGGRVTLQRYTEEEVNKILQEDSADIIDISRIEVFRNPQEEQPQKSILMLIVAQKT